MSSSEEGLPRVVFSEDDQEKAAHILNNWKSAEDAFATIRHGIRICVLLPLRCREGNCRSCAIAARR